MIRITPFKSLRRRVVVRRQPAQTKPPSFRHWLSVARVFEFAGGVGL
jgi:hypothetical protein